MTNNMIKSVDRGLRILECLKTNNGATIDELTATFDISESSIHRHLTTLESHGYVVREGGSYYLGLGFVEMARYAKERKHEYEIAERITDTLASQTGDRATYVTEENGIGIVIASETGEHGILADIEPGQRIPLNASAVGKAILANLPLSRVQSILDRHGLPELTENTITNRETLLSELEQVRQRGYSINRSERIEGIHAVGVAVEDDAGKTIGAFSVSGPTRRMTDDRISEEIAEVLLNAAQEFELRSRYNERRG
jgi:DNA-binding IclR family transcriptional regulator